jgi:adenosine deaminase
VSLHAGELWLGLVRPDDLRDHIYKAVHIGHAKRIGHGTDIVFGTDYKALLAYMAEHEIMVEINLTSSDALLGVKGSAHPYSVYKNAGVPISFSTDDEGVARIDLTHEYMRAVQEQGVSYAELKRYTYNGLKYAFIDDASKAKMIKDLDQRFAAFESQF